MAEHSQALGAETITANEQALIDELVRLNLAGLNAAERPARRGQHPKHHGCVHARFVVTRDVPEPFRVGVFAVPAVFDALIRFSNGASFDDREGDAHGMAIKLLGVPGPKLLPGREAETTQDFVLMDNEIFIIGGLDDYLHFTRHVPLIKTRLLGLPVGKTLFGLKYIFTGRKATVDRIKTFVSKKPTSPLASHYWSTTPYALGPAAVKYMAISPLAEGPPGPPLRTADGLRHALGAHLERNHAGFVFGAHVQSDATAHPVEDPTVPWSEHGAQFVKLATIEIPPQPLAANDKLAEDLAFSPWHALPAHRPLGAMNRARRAIYEATAVHRHRANGVRPPGTSEAVG